MKIQNSGQFVDVSLESRRVRLLKSAMIYIILFSVGIVVYIGASRSNGQRTILDNVLGVYNAGETADSTLSNTVEILNELDKFNTLTIDDDANLPSCENLVTETNYPGDQNCDSEECIQRTKNGRLSGWVSIWACADGTQPNSNLGCKAGTFVGTTVHTMAVEEIPVLGFLADTNISDKGIGETVDPFKYTQAPCFYNMFRNPFSSADYANPLSFSMDADIAQGPVFALSNSGKLAVIPYPALATGSQCWGFNPDNFDDTARFDIKAFLEKYKSTGADEELSPDTLWGWILDLFKKPFDKSIRKSNGNAEAIDPDEMKGKTTLCDNLPGGPVVKLNELKPVPSDATYEITRKVYEFTKVQMCDMMLYSPNLLAGQNMQCTVDDGSNDFTLTLQNKDQVFNPERERQEWYYDPISGTWKLRIVKYCVSENMCGQSWECEETKEEVYTVCKTNPANIPAFNGSNLRYKVSSDSFPYINLPNGMKMLTNAYSLLQTVAPYSVKIGDNIGIEMKTSYALYDANRCSTSGCTYGQNLEYREDTLASDPLSLIDTSLKPYIDIERNQPYSIPFTSGNNLSTVYTQAGGSDTYGSSKNDVSYIFPYVGNVPQMYEMISVYLTNISNEDTGSTIVEWLFGQAPLPFLKNATLGDVVLKLCKDENYPEERNDCLDPYGKYMLADKKDRKPGAGGGESTFSGFGIDVSHWQGNIDWEAVASDPQNVQFAIIKATDGLNTYTNYIDQQFNNNWNGSGDAGLKHSAYHYFVGSISGSDQADFFIDTVEAVGATADNLDSPLVIDVELTNNEGIDEVDFTNNLKEMIDSMESRGYTPMIYTSISMWPLLTTSPDWGNDQYPLWIAAWSDPGDDPSQYNPGNLPDYWDTWTIWQFAGDDPAGPMIHVNGIAGVVDANLANPNLESGSSTVTTNQIVQTNTAVLGATSLGREDDIDTMGTYLLADVWRKNYKKLFDASDTPGDPGVPYFPPDDEDDDDYGDIIPCTDGGAEYELGDMGFGYDHDPLPGFLQQRACYVPNKIVLHWTTGNASTTTEGVAQYWADYYERTGLELSCHFGLDYSGHLVQWLHMYDNAIQFEQCVGGNANRGSISFEIVGQYFMYDEDEYNVFGPTEQQQSVILNSICTLMEKYSIPLSEVYGHYELNDLKDDPGTTFMEWVREQIGTGNYCSTN